ncbi:MAG: hypothetical protein A2845_01625 [Candidatus Lloydbacteria bacterium RIFCSPHIGHO2_01_FULL_49_22]|uniref:Peptidase C39-like domain-containing protein n=1 Tax=Candidatus Lloydbacteria bacterium RIFCSPHIGHO2_01_FULL_49_22 TaxID=1798658 RepID=A0A1G2CXJ6_9BACT|nr:MAG: hypothetical protein A2845_01625 [Candidatus Lloydbacteria bacterium RIFCSPHIGHO2_01_FULL_49_22]OGZ09997.1 MAG: hypothetical protein A3C14_04790 [Candidatus Lloydbacteria bacterium RIFCSPHIGHO2_02_FULL_50_18]
MFQRMLASVFVSLLCFLPISPAFAERYTVTVDYSQSLRQMITNARFDDVGPAVKEENFPRMEKGKIVVAVELISIDQYVVGDEALKKIALMGYRPATLHETLAMIAADPTLLNKSGPPIIALGSPWLNKNGHIAVILMRTATKAETSIRMIYPIGAGVLGWHEQVRFAVVPK